MRQALDGIDNRGAFESYKDFALNEFFRRDVYVKGQAPCSPAAAMYGSNVRCTAHTLAGPSSMRS